MDRLTVNTEPACMHGMPIFPELDTAKAAYTAVSTAESCVS